VQKEAGMKREKQISVTTAAIKNALKTHDIVIVACGDGGKHLVYGSVRRTKGKQYANTSYGEQEIISVSVYEEE
jgi:hypothetical protein